jgi:hypothetical protein
MGSLRRRRVKMRGVRAEEARMVTFAILIGKQYCYNIDNKNVLQDGREAMDKNHLHEHII